MADHRETSPLCESYCFMAGFYFKGLSSNHGLDVERGRRSLVGLTEAQLASNLPDCQTFYRALTHPIATLNFVHATY
jgi:hypothetical protein